MTQALGHDLPSHLTSARTLICHCTPQQRPQKVSWSPWCPPLRNGRPKSGRILLPSITPVEAGLSDAQCVSSHKPSFQTWDEVTFSLASRLFSSRYKHVGSRAAGWVGVKAWDTARLDLGSLLSRDVVHPIASQGKPFCP